MKKKNIIAILLLTFIIGAMLSLDKANNESSEAVENILKPVQVLTIEESIESDGFYYIGVVEPKELKKMSSKYAGRILNVHVEKGDAISLGDPLLTLEKKDRKLDLGASQADMASSIEHMNKAKKALDYSNGNVKKLKILYDNGALSKQQYELSLVENQSIKSDYNAAKELVNKAKISVEYKENRVSDAVIKSEIEGYVVDVLYKSGENIEAGYPLVFIRSKDQIVKVGISQKDISKISDTTPVEFEVNETLIAGNILNIAQVPNEETRTFIVEIQLDTEMTRLGMIGNVYFEIEKKKGIKIPITTIFSESSDFVYVVEKNIVEKRTVTLNKISDTNVYVDGLKSGDQLITSGMKRVKLGEKVSVVQP